MDTRTHEKNLKRAFAVAEAARARGDHPFGAVLADRSGQALMESGNRVVTEADCTAHAELRLIRQACQQLTPEQLAGATLYASCEPCAMCASALHWSGIGGLVYGLTSSRLYELVGGSDNVYPLRLTAAEVLERGGRGLPIVGPLLAEQAEAVHVGFWGERA